MFKIRKRSLKVSNFFTLFNDYSPNLKNRDIRPSKLELLALYLLRRQKLGASAKEIATLSAHKGVRAKRERERRKVWGLTVFTAGGAAAAARGDYK